MTIAKAEHPVVDDFFKQDSDLKSNLSKASTTSTSVTSLPDQDGKATTTTTTTTTNTSIKSEESSKKNSSPAVGRKMNPIYKAFRGLLWALYFNLGASLISMTQVLSLPLAILAPGVYRRHINRTEGHFGAFLLKMNQLFAPSDIVLTGDESIRGLVKQPFKGLKEGSVDKDGKESLQLKQGLLDEEVFLDMPERLVLISNHQIYSDWMYLWCFSYFADKHRALKIILRGDLTWIPVFGWGMRFFDFILLKRNDWAHDKRAIEENLERVNAKDPLWLVVFPEGTVVSKDTRKRSVAFAEKAGLADHRHVLLPRTSGLFVCINKLRGSVEYVYDATVGYSGINYGEIPQELYPLPGLYLNQAQPKDINMHLRRFAIKDIPETELEFVEWVRARWQEKDDLMEEFYTTGRFPSQLALDSESEDVDGGETKEQRQVTHEDVNGRKKTTTIITKTTRSTKSTKGRRQGQSIRIPLKSRSLLDYVPPSAMNLLVLPVLAYAVRYALQQSA
ncbi:MAG: acyltransferase-domain-containing protein [Podila humilis]|nr:MAG: acyltransferase-domain-containing protein [Podila humilis]